MHSCINFQMISISDLKRKHDFERNMSCQSFDVVEYQISTSNKSECLKNKERCQRVFDTIFNHLSIHLRPTFDLHFVDTSVCTSPNLIMSYNRMLY